MKLFHYTFLALLVSFVLAPNEAEATTVQNEVSVRASTGGNSSAGQVVEGEARASVFIETTVDGEVVQHVEEEKTGTGGESVEIKKEVEYKSDIAEVEIETEASVEIQEQSDSTTVNHEVEQSQEEQENKKESLLIASIVGFFRKIFSWFLA
ncbi:MAG: hypothetical protein HYT49_03950 [Candidatus Wildermuthbacteria bacterium]|nr:hypothetical protein [Candidatus Wildermuthbacteria bacterium]